jgi:glycosyltransferase involved in cell wall biosynthesis
VVIPALNERDSLGELVEVLEHSFPADAIPTVEFIVVDDGSTDGSSDLLESLKERHPRLRSVIRSERGGQTAALWDGLAAARGAWIAHLDADLQNDPRDLPDLFHTAQQGYDAVLGVRAQRRDDLGRRLASRFANGVRRASLHDSIQDVGCSTRVVKAELLRAIPALPNMHRYLPAVIERLGARIAQVPVSHHPRRHGQSKYTNLGRGLRSARDLLRVRRFLREHQASR